MARREAGEIDLGQATQGSEALQASALVQAATTALEDRVVEVPGACWQGRGRGRCGGTVAAAQIGAEIHWVCQSCQRTGRIVGWQAGAFDRRKGRPAEVVRGVWRAGTEWPKVSVTLGGYAWPLLESLPGVAPLWQQALSMAATTWNAATLEEHGGAVGAMQQVRDAVAGEPMPALVVEVMLARKQRLFRQDYRGILLKLVEPRGGQMWIEAEARDSRRG